MWETWQAEDQATFGNTEAEGDLGALRWLAETSEDSMLGGLLLCVFWHVGRRSGNFVAQNWKRLPIPAAADGTAFATLSALRPCSAGWGDAFLNFLLSSVIHPRSIERRVHSHEVLEASLFSSSAVPLDDRGRDFERLPCFTKVVKVLCWWRS